MKNPLHLFRSRSKVEVPPHLAPFPPLQPRGPSTKTVAVSLTMLFASFAGLAAGLKWLQSDQPRDNRPWEPHETLMAAAPASAQDVEKFEAPNPDALAPLDSTAPTDASSPAPTATPPPADRPAPPIAERLADKPSKPSQSAKGLTTSKTTKSPRVKPRSSKIASVAKATPSPKRRMADRAAKPLRSRSPYDDRENEAPEFVQADSTPAEQQFRNDEPGYPPNRGEYSDHDNRVLRRFFDEDQSDYYARSPRREVVVLRTPQRVQIPPPGVVVRYRINYAVRDFRNAPNARTENRIWVRRVNPGYRVIAIREHEENW